MKSLTGRYWNGKNWKRANEEDLTLARQTNLAPEIIKILKNRGVSQKNEIEQFLYPSLNNIEPPSSLKGLERGAVLVCDAIENGRKLFIWGDYDVDGVTGTALLLRFFTSLGVDPQWFIPNRFDDGYGVTVSALQHRLKPFSDQKPLIITVDCGITDREAIEFAKNEGCSVVVTDHHEPEENPVGADAIINVKQPGCAFKYKNLSGVGTAFYLALGIRAELQRRKFFTDGKEIPNMKNLLELVAIGTVADMVDLTGCNRIMVRGGFEVIDQNPSPGVKALLKCSDLLNSRITSEDIAFQVGPKINAAGRIGDATEAVSLLIEKESKQAERIAKKLTQLNVERKKLCQECLETTLDYNYSDLFLGDNRIVVVEVDGSLGILGIVASQLVEKVKKPVIAVTEVTGVSSRKVLKGSCRSVPGVDIHDALVACERYLVQYGGHKQAAGVTVLKENFELFREEINTYLAAKPERKEAYEEVDLELDIERALSKNFIHQLHLLEPFGVGNRKPLFLDRGVIFQDIRRIGKTGDHITFMKRGKFSNKKCIGFGLGDVDAQLRERKKIDVVFSVSKSTYKQSVTHQAQLEDIL